MNWTKLPVPLYVRRDVAATCLSKAKDHDNDDDDKEDGKRTSEHSEKDEEEPIGFLVVGGYDGSKTTAAVEFFEWNTKRWWALPSLQRPRSGCSIGSVHNVAVVVGGCCDHERLDTVESFSFGRSKTWETLPSMISCRWYPAAVGLAQQNIILVAGGRNNSWQELNSVESFDLNTREWTLATPMKVPRFACSAVQIGNSPQVAVIGGYDGKRWVTSVEMYSVQENVWSDLPNMPIASMFGSASFVTQKETGGSSYIVFVGTRDTRNDSTTSSTVHGHDYSNASPTSVTGRVHGDTQPRRGSMSKQRLQRYQQQPGEQERHIVVQVYDIDSQKWNVLTTVSSNPENGGNRKTTNLVEGCALVSYGRYVVAVGGCDPSNNQDNKHACYWNPFEPIDFVGGGILLSPQRKNVWGCRRSSLGQSTIHSTASSSAPMPLVPQIMIAGPDESGNMIPRDVSVCDTPIYESVHLDSSIPIKLSNTSILANEPLGMGSYHTTMTRHLDPRAGFGPIQAVSTIPCSSSDETNGMTKHVENIVVFDRVGEDGRYTGEVSIEDGKPHGKGEMQWNVNKDKYDGEWQQGYRHGYGRMSYANGDSYEGWFHDDKKHGRGTYQWKDGRQYEGAYVNGKAEDPSATMTWKNGTIYTGPFVNGKRTGKGTIRFPNSVSYQGDFVNGKYEGFGTCTFGDGRTYTGEWRKGKAHGVGKLSNADGSILHDGDWSHDVPIVRT